MHGGLLWFLALFYVGCYVLQHHYGVIDHHTYGNGKRGHRYDVQGVACSKQIDDGSEQGYWDGEYDDEGCSPAPQEGEHHEHNDQEGDYDGLLQGVEGVQDVAGVVQHGCDLHVGRQSLLYLLHLLLDLLDHIHGVGSGLLLDYDAGSLHTIAVLLLVALLHTVVEGGDILQIDRTAIGIADHDVQNLLRSLELLFDADGVSVGSYVDIAARHIPVL